MQTRRIRLCIRALREAHEKCKRDAFGYAFAHAARHTGNAIAHTRTSARRVHHSKNAGNPRANWAAAFGYALVAWGRAYGNAYRHAHTWAAISSPTLPRSRAVAVW